MAGLNLLAVLVAKPGFSATELGDEDLLNCSLWDEPRAAIFATTKPTQLETQIEEVWGLRNLDCLKAPHDVCSWLC